MCPRLRFLQPIIRRPLLAGKRSKMYLGTIKWQNHESANLLGRSRRANQNSRPPHPGPMPTLRSGITSPNCSTPVTPTHRWRDAFAGVPPKDRGVKPTGVPHTLWQLLEHIRIAQWDILEFSRNGKHVSPDLPSGYWPATEAPPSEKTWDDSIAKIQRELLEMRELILDPRTDLYSKIPHGTGQTILAEALLIADHNAYHTGQAVLIRRILGEWKE